MTARIIGRYLLCDELAAGGMASVHFGLLLGDEGFTKTVAIKRLHPQFAKDPEFALALLDEGRLQSRVHHPNVAAVLDVVRSDDELLLVMEYLHAAPLAHLRRAARATGERPSLPVLCAVVVGMLRGLHAAHEARSMSGEPLLLVHRDVSPQNVLVGADGIVRVVDFGIARAAVRSQITVQGTIKGKPGYMAPEQFVNGPVDRAVDIYAAGVVLWEQLTSERLFPGGDLVAVARTVLDAHIDPPSAVIPGLPPAFDAITRRALERDPAARFATAGEFADALEAIGPLGSPGEVAAWVQRSAGDSLAARSLVLQRIEREGESARRIAPGPGSTSAPAIVIPPTGPVTLASAVAPITAPRRSRAPYAVASAAALLAAGMAGATLARGPRDPRPVVEATAGASLAPEAASTASPQAPAEAPSASATATASAAPTASAKATPAKRAAAPTAPRATATAARAAPCVTIGEDGIKRWNPRCK